MKTYFLLAPLCVALVSGCSSETEGTPASPYALDPPPPSGGQQLATTTYSLDPGQEKYLCWTFQSPEDAERAITEVEPIVGDLVHHIALFTTLTPEPEGPFECNTLAKTTWLPVWAGGAGGKGIKLPDQVGFKIKPKTQYLIQLHLQNTQFEALSAKSGLNLRYAPDASTITPAGLYALATFSLTIPANAKDFQQVTSCNTDRTMNVFAAFPHMHKLGKSLVFEGGATEATATKLYEINPWPFGEQPMEPVDFKIQTGDFLRATCTWDNTRPTDVTFGESSDDEMCIFTFFYYPFDGLAGCIF